MFEDIVGLVASVVDCNVETGGMGVIERGCYSLVVGAEDAGGRWRSENTSLRLLKNRSRWWKDFVELRRGKTLQKASATVSR